MKSNIVTSIYSYLFPICWLRKTILFFPILQCYISINPYYTEAIAKRRGIKKLPSAKEA